MKNIDVSKTVMEKVARYETKRSHRWMWGFYVLMTVCLVLFGFFLWHAWVILGERHSFDLLTLFKEDKEIIAEFWQDTLLTFIEELPERMIVRAGIVLLGVIIVFVVTRKRRKIIQRKMGMLAKRYKKEQK